MEQTQYCHVEADRNGSRRIGRPGPGWAVAGGIIVGLGASYAWDAAGGSELGAKVGGWVGDRPKDAGSAIGNTAVDAWNRARTVFG